MGNRKRWKPTARNKLNAANLLGTVVFSAVVGVASESLLAGLVAWGVLVTAAVVAGEIRL